MARALLWLNSLIVFYRYGSLRTSNDQRLKDTIMTWTLATLLLGAAATLGLAAGPAAATPITNGSTGLLTSNDGHLEATFLYISAADESSLTLPLLGTSTSYLAGSNPSLPIGIIFDNKKNKIGDTYKVAGLSAGEMLPFTLHNITAGLTFMAGTP